MAVSFTLKGAKTDKNGNIVEHHWDMAGVGCPYCCKPGWLVVQRLERNSYDLESVGEDGSLDLGVQVGCDEKGTEVFCSACGRGLTVEELVDAAKAQDEEETENGKK